MEIEIHYNAFQTISEQLNDMLTDSQKNTAIRRLHKQVIKSIKGKKAEDK